MLQKTKSAMISRLSKIYNSSSSNLDICLATIAICLLHNISTDENMTKCSRLHRNQSCEQGTGTVVVNEVE